MNKLPQDVQHHVRSLESLANMVPAGIAANATKQAADFLRTQAQSLIDAEAGQRHWKANHDNMVSRLRIFTQRQDLPKNLADRLPWYREMVTLQEQVAQLRAQLAAVQQGVQPSPESDSIAPTLMTNDQAIAWAWADVRKDLGTENWTTGDSCNFYGFFLHGWNYRVQYELQRNATKAAVMREIATHPTQQGLDAQALKQSFREYLSVSEHIDAGGHAMDSIATDLTRIVLAEEEVSAVIARRVHCNTSGQSGEDAENIRAAAQAKQGGV